MSLPNALQLVFHDHTGEHTIVNHQGNFNALHTIAIALQNTNSVSHVKITEIEIDNSESSYRGIYYNTRYVWTKSF